MCGGGGIVGGGRGNDRVRSHGGVASGQLSEETISLDELWEGRNFLAL